MHTDFAGRGDESERELKCKATGSRKRPSRCFQDYLCRENQDTWERLRRACKGAVNWAKDATTARTTFALRVCKARETSQLFV